MYLEKKRTLYVLQKSLEKYVVMKIFFLNLLFIVKESQQINLPVRKYIYIMDNTKSVFTML